MQNLLLLIGAFILLALIILSVNNMLVHANISIISNETQITGIGLAQTLLEEISSCAFDEKTTSGQFVRFAFQLTTASNFGQESGDTFYDDIDDYHNYTTTINSQRIEGYELSVKISYANPFYPKYNFPIRTFLKRIQVTVKNQKYMQQPDSLVISSVIGYYK